MTAQQPSSRGALDHCDFSGCWTMLDPFWGSNGPNLSKKGSGVSFSSCWTPFCAVSGLDPPKRIPPPLQLRPSPFSWCWTTFCAMSGLDPPKSGAMAPDFRLATFSCCLDPFLCRERLGSSEKGSCDLASNLLLGPPFQQPYHTETLYLC